MRRFAALTLVFLLSASFSAVAQVHRCKDASGKTTYSDAPCAPSQAGQLIERQKSREQILEERLQAAEANERKYRAQDAQRADRSFDMQQQQQRQQMRASSAQAPQNLASSRECKEAQKDLDFISKIRTTPQNEKRLRTNSAIARVNASCGSNIELMQEPTKIIVQPRPTICHHIGGGTSVCN